MLDETLGSGRESFTERHLRRNSTEAKQRAAIGYEAVLVVALMTFSIGGLAVAVPVLLAEPDRANPTATFADRVRAGEPGTARRDRFFLGAAAGCVLAIALYASRLVRTPVDVVEVEPRPRPRPEDQHFM